MEQPNYYAIIPAVVRYNKNLKANEKLLYGEISALANKRGYCSASNGYFAELYDTTPETVSRWVANLVKQGCLKSQIIKDGNNQIIERRLYLCEVRPPIDENINTPMTKTSRGIDENVKGGIDENVKENNTRLNNTYTPLPPNETDCADALVSANAKTGGVVCVEENPTAKPKADKNANVPMAEIVAAYNEVCGHILPKAIGLPDHRKRHIGARWREYLNTENQHGKVRYTDKESGLKWWKSLFAKVLLEPRWCGAMESGWKADLTWILKPQNFQKILEFVPTQRRK